MSSLYSTTAIILSRRDFRETDRWYTALTPEFGKIEFVARGGHKSLAKLTPHLEMISEVELLLVRGRQYQIVAGTERRRAFFGLHERLSQLTLARSALHLVDSATKPLESDSVLYELLEQWLEFLCCTESISNERAGFLLGSFTLKLMDVCGYRPELRLCVSCHRSIEQNSYLWHALRGGVVCESCTRTNQQAWFSARTISDEALKLVRFALHEPFSEQMRPRLESEHLESFHEVLESFIISHFPIIPAVSLRTACSI
ncbi:DNA repair protein RecO [Candidatus Uhrbacteria bacterium]|nr:DNA repair protein RecO [Candidatus Uhrbacteria bacterium]